MQEEFFNFQHLERFDTIYGVFFKIEEYAVLFVLKNIRP